MRNTQPIHVIACDKREAFAQGSASDEAIHSHHVLGEMDCFAALAMTGEVATEIPTGVIPGRAQARTRNLAQQSRGSGSIRFAARPERRL